MPLPLELPLGQAALDRDADSRAHADLFDELWAAPTTRIVVLHNGKTLVSAGDKPALKFFNTDEATAGRFRVYLGKTRAPGSLAEASDLTPGSDMPEGSAIVLSVLSDNAAAAIDAGDAEWADLRSVGAKLPHRDAAIVMQALAIANWHESHQHCPNCGTPTIVEQGGWVRRCFKEDTQLFARTDPAIIVSVIDEQGRILLGSQASWAENRWSVLAGYVDSGESLEAAVIREMKEESGLLVTEPTYLASQSWPFPYSLMLGFTAKVDLAATGQTIKPDGVEIVRLRWFSRAELAAEAAEILLPNRISIARSLIEHWYGGQLISASEGTHGKSGDR